MCRCPRNRACGRHPMRGNCRKPARIRRSGLQLCVSHNQFFIGFRGRKNPRVRTSIVTRHESHPPHRALALHGIGYTSSCIRQNLNPVVPVHPLASFDVSGQQPVSIQEPHLTEIFNLIHYMLCGKRASIADVRDACGERTTRRTCMQSAKNPPALPGGPVQGARS